jgi:hypothetical protein
MSFCFRKEEIGRFTLLILTICGRFTMNKYAFTLVSPNGSFYIVP